MGDVKPFQRPRRQGHQCICGAFWRPGFSSDPAWLLTADRRLSSFIGVLHCQGCGRDKLAVLKEQAERRRAETPPAIPRPERTAARVLPFRKPDPNN